MRNSGKILLLSVWLPSVAAAHGDQVLALPVAQGGVLIALSLAVLFLRMRVPGRALFLILPILAMMGTWFLPGSVFGPIEQKYGYGYGPVLFLGAIPPLVVAVVVFAIFRCRDEETSSQPPAPTRPGSRGSL